MWLLLVAAGSGYLARCWQNALKARPALTDCAHISSSPETPINTASSAYGSPNSSRERRSGTNKEDAHGSKKAQDLRRQLSFGGRSFQARGLGKKLLYDTCGHSSSRFSRSEDGLEGSEETKVLIESPTSLAGKEDTAKRKGACCGLAGRKRPDVTDSVVSPMTQTEGWVSMSDGRYSGQSPQEARGKDYSICPRPNLGASPDQDENTFEISLVEVEGFSSRHTFSSPGRLSSSSQDGETRRGVSDENYSMKSAAMGSSSSSIAIRTSRPHDSDSKPLEDLDVSKAGNRMSSGVSVQDADNLGACNKDGQMHFTYENATNYGGEGARVKLQVACCPDRRTTFVADVDSGLEISAEQGSAMHGMKPLCNIITLSCDTLQSAECEKEDCFLDHDDQCDTIKESGLDESEVCTSGFDKLSVPSCLLNTSENSAGLGSKSEPTGNILLSFLNGKRVKDGTTGGSKDTEEFLGDTSGKRKKDSNQGSQHAVDQDSLSRNISYGLLDPSLGCLGFDATWFELQPDREEKLKHGLMPRKIKTPSKSARGRSSIRKTRWMRESPKIVSSLDSCLRAQLVRDCEEIDEYSVPCALKFPVITSQELAVADVDGLQQKVKKANMKTLQVSDEGHHRVTVPGNDGKLVSDSGTIGCQLCQNPLFLGRTKGACALGAKSQATCNLYEGLSKNIQVPSTIKKRKLSEKGLSPPSSGDTDKDTVVLPMDGLLFSFGVGVGVMSMVNTSKEEVERIYLQLRETEDYVECLKQELDLKKGTYSHTNFSDVEESLQGDFPKLTATEDKETNGNLSVDYGQEPSESARSEGTVGIMDSGIQMAELEAELEAELQLMERNLTGESSLCHRRQFSGLSDLDLDGVADVIDGDLKTNGLPRPLDPDDDQIASAHEDVHPTNWAVSPRDLDRRLQKVLIARQEESIAELESGLHAAESKLILKENEIQWWKDRFQKLTELTRLPSKAEKDPLSLTYEGAIHEQNFSKENYFLDSGDIRVNKAVGGFPEGMHNQYSNSEKRQSIGTSKAMSETGPSVDNLSGVGSTLLDDALVSEAANDYVCDEFLKAVKESGAITENENFGASDALLPVDDGKLVNSLGARGDPVTGVPDCNKSTSDVDRCHEGRSISSLTVQPGQAGDWADAASRSANPMESEMRQETWGPKKLYARRFGSKDDFGPNFRASRISADNEWGPLKLSARLPGGDSWSYGGASTSAVEPDMASVTPDDNSGYGHAPRSSSAGVDGESVERFAACPTDFSEEANYMDFGPISRAGANTPVDILLLQQSVSSAEDGLVPAEGLVLSETGTSVMDKIRHWEGLAQWDSPHAGVGVGKLSDWEAQSWTSESELVHPAVEDDTLCRENQVENTLGEILIKRIVEKTRRGSHIVREAQTVLATEYGDDLSECCQTATACTLESSTDMASYKNLSGCTQMEDDMTCRDGEHGKGPSMDCTHVCTSSLSHPKQKMLQPDSGQIEVAAGDVECKIGKRRPSVTKDGRGVGPLCVL